MRPSLAKALGTLASLASWMRLTCPAAYSLRLHWVFAIVAAELAAALTLGALVPVRANAMPDLAGWHNVALALVGMVSAWWVLKPVRQREWLPYGLPLPILWLPAPTLLLIGTLILPATVLTELLAARTSRIVPPAVFHADIMLLDTALPPGGDRDSKERESVLALGSRYLLTPLSSGTDEIDSPLCVALTSVSPAAPICNSSGRAIRSPAEFRLCVERVLARYGGLSDLAAGASACRSRDRVVLERLDTRQGAFVRNLVAREAVERRIWLYGGRGLFSLLALASGLAVLATALHSFHRVHDSIVFLPFVASPVVANSSEFLSGGGALGYLWLIRALLVVAAIVGVVAIIRAVWTHRRSSRSDAGLAFAFVAVPIWFLVEGLVAYNSSLEASGSIHAAAQKTLPWGASCIGYVTSVSVVVRKVGHRYRDLPLD